MKAYTIIRDIIFFILGLAILCVGIYTAKMTEVIDSNLIYVNRKIPPTDYKKGIEKDKLNNEDGRKRNEFKPAPKGEIEEPQEQGLAE